MYLHKYGGKIALFITCNCYKNIIILFEGGPRWHIFFELVYELWVNGLRYISHTSACVEYYIEKSSKVELLWIFAIPNALSLVRHPIEILNHVNPCNLCAWFYSTSVPTTQINKAGTIVSWQVDTEGTALNLSLLHQLIH